MHPIDFICGRQGDYMFSEFKSSLGESWAADLMARTSCTIWTEQNRKANWKGLDSMNWWEETNFGWDTGIWWDMMGYDIPQYPTIALISMQSTIVHVLNSESYGYVGYVS